MLSRLLRRKPQTPIRPDGPLAVIGDVHGCLGLLERALARAAGHRVICVGDYIDRGPESAAVLHTLFTRPDVTCLIGNHEEMFLRFLDDPEQAGPTWLRYGGDATLESMGLRDMLRADADLPALRDTVIDILGPDLIAWLRELPAYLLSGNVGIVHAGADPALPLDTQMRKSLVWGHPQTGRPRDDGLWIVRGHTVVAEPVQQNQLISIDTGAYATGRLSLAFLDDESIQFETVTG